MESPLHLHASSSKQHLDLPLHPSALVQGGSPPCEDPSPSLELTEDPVPSSEAWTPAHVYEDVSIGDLKSGPRKVSFTGRVVNIYDHNVESKWPQAAKGCLILLMKDDTGSAILIKLWYATQSYNVVLGTIITVWTTHIHPTASTSNAMQTLSVDPASILASIFPERDSACWVQIQSERNLSSISRNSKATNRSQALEGLISLENFAHGGGNEIPGAKILVCVVAKGKPLSVKTKTGYIFTTLAFGISDISSSTPYQITISQPLLPSAQVFKLKSTVLLITSPRLHQYQTGCLTLSSRSQIEIDPDVPEAELLRKHVVRETFSINQPFPDHLFDLEDIESAVVKIQFTLATFNEFITAMPDQIYTGYLPVILSQLCLTKLINNGQLFCMECCSMPLYSNTASAKCDQCERKITLLLNPNILGDISDESGGISSSHEHEKSPSSPLSKFSRVSTRSTSPQHQPHPRPKKQQHTKLLISDRAFTSLLGRTPTTLASMCAQTLPSEIRNRNLAKLRLLEARLLYLRVILLVAWTGEWGGGRLVILNVLGG